MCQGLIHSRIIRLLLMQGSNNKQYTRRLTELHCMDGPGRSSGSPTPGSGRSSDRFPFCLPYGCYHDVWITACAPYNPDIWSPPCASFCCSIDILPSIATSVVPSSVEIFQMFHCTVLLSVRPHFFFLELYRKLDLWFGLN